MARAARFFKELDVFEPGNAKFCSPVQYCGLRLEPRPQLSSTFGLSPDHRNFRKNFRESLGQAKPRAVYTHIWFRRAWCVRDSVTAWSEGASWRRTCGLWARWGSFWGLTVLSVTPGSLSSLWLERDFTGGCKEDKLLQPFSEFRR